MQAGTFPRARCALRPSRTCVAPCRLLAAMRYRRSRSVRITVRRRRARTLQLAATMSQQQQFTSPRVLVVGANRDLAPALARSLDLAGHRVTHLATATDLQEAVRRVHADAIVLETHPSDVGVLATCRRLR